MLLSIYDVLIIALYFIIIAIVAIVSSYKNQNVDDFILGGRKMPWGAVLFSIIATEVSAVTFLAAPAVGFSENLNYLQFGMGSILARFLIAGMFLSVYYAIRCYSIYEYLKQRFGPQTHRCAVSIFFLTRLVSSAVRLLIATAAFAILLDISFFSSLVIFSLIAITYTALGGIKAVIWTDVIQSSIFISAAIAMLIYLQYAIGWGDIWQIAQQSHHLEIFHWGLNSTQTSHGAFWGWFNDPNIVYLALLNGFFITTASMGTDQDMVQRMLTCKNVRYAQFSVILSGFIALAIALLFLLIGVGLFVYYYHYPDPNLPQISTQGLMMVNSDAIFPYFIRQVLPPGLQGLIIIGIIAAAMSSLDSAISALSSSAMVDFYKPLRKYKDSQQHCLTLLKVFVVSFGLIVASIAFALRNSHGFLWLSFKFMSIGYGALLGIFLVGLLTNRGDDRANSIVMLISSSLIFILFILIDNQLVTIAWSWMIIIGTLSTFFLAVIWKRRVYGGVQQDIIIHRGDMRRPLQ